MRPFSKLRRGIPDDDEPENWYVCTRQWLQAGIAFALCATLLGCIGATPLHKRTRTSEGTVVKDIDLSFLHPGQTTRAEVKEKLKLIDTGYQGDHFFLGRWSSSTWAAWIVYPDPRFPSAVGRVWKSGNLLVEFDDAGVVKRFEPFNDAKALGYLAPVAADTPLQLASPLELPVKYYLIAGGQFVDAKIVLSKGAFDFEELGERKKKQKFSLPANEVLRVETPFIIRFPDPTYISQRLHCAKDLKKIGGPRGRDINLKVTMPQLVTLMSYVAEAAKSPANAPEADRK
jgi:outer membrane protein assembly factor BamE (lipoprotein component of BamABCDE complex)